MASTLIILIITGIACGPITPDADCGPADVSGTIHDERGIAFQVTLLRADGLRLEVTSVPYTGTFEFPEVPPGDYVLHDSIPVTVCSESKDRRVHADECMCV